MINSKELSDSEIVPLNRSVFDGDPALADAVRKYGEHALSPNTLRARRADWQAFSIWCRDRQQTSLPAAPSTVAGYLADCSEKGKAVATITRYAQTITAAHQAAGLPSPTLHAGVRGVLAGIRRTRGVKQNQKAAFTADIAMRSVPHGDDLISLRNRAILLVGLATAMRRSELSALIVTDIRYIDEGAVIEIRRSKTDQEGEGQFVLLPKLDGEYCPVASLRAWLAASGIAEGSVFRGTLNHKLRATALSGRQIALVLKKAVAAAGLDPAVFSGHSMRAGFVTDQRNAGTEWTAIMEQTRHKSLEMAKRYARYSPDAMRNTKIADAMRKLFTR